MKKLALVFLALLMVAAMALPATAMARDQRVLTPPRSLNLTLTPQSIDQPVISQATWPQANPLEANSWPVVDMVDGAPAIVGWVVANRTIYGTASGDADGEFTFTYGGVLDTLQSGSIHGVVVITTEKGRVYLLAQGTSEASIRETYTFEEISTWCQAVGITVSYFFAEFYGVPDLAGMEEAEIAPLYGTVLPLLPKTLADSFKGTVTVESGTGNYAAIHGTARFNPTASKPLILSVFPNQHVYNISGAIMLRGFRSVERARLPQEDAGKVRDAIENWIKDRRR